MDCPPPRPIQIISSEPDHTLRLDERALRGVLLSPEVRDKKVVVLSVAGALRKGKSFLLNFLLRFLDKGGLSGNQEWLGEDDQPLNGFNWTGGCEMVTTGILLWSKPYTATIPSTGEEVAILLLDTQGAFDIQSTVRDNATIFALSTMISSVQVYNLSAQIQENDLQHLDLFTDYGCLAMEQCDGVKPFQSLCFLVRDWFSPAEHQYGKIGGSTYLDKILRLTETQHTEIQVVRKHIRSCFESVSCFLLPYPGKKVAITTEYNTFAGKLIDIDDDFKEHLKELAPMLLSLNNLIVKEISGNPLTGRELLVYFKSYTEMFQGNELPTPMTIVEATAEANNRAAQMNALREYTSLMEKVCGDNKPYLSPDKLESKHCEALQVCLEMFRSTRKMGGEAISRKFERKLELQIIEAYERIKKWNSMKKSSYWPKLLSLGQRLGFMAIIMGGSIGAYMLGAAVGI